MADWTFLSNHARVLEMLAQQPDIRIREVAQQVEITERTAHRIVSELIAGGYVKANKSGRRNSYAINKSAPLRHRLDGEHTVGELIDVLSGLP